MSGTVVTKFTCFYCDSAPVRIQLSNGSIVIVKVTCFYSDSTVVRKQYPSILGGSIVNKYITTHVNDTLLLCKYCSSKLRSIVFKLALADTNCTVGGNNCTTNESIIETVIISDTFCV